MLYFMIRRWKKILGFILKKITKSGRNTVAWYVRCNSKIKPGRVVFWSYNFKQYGCNPRYLSDYLLNHYPDMEIYWVFRSGVDTSQVDNRVHKVKFRSMEYLRVMATAEFLITNTRTDPYFIYWHKRPGQKYFQLWHGAIALKRIEKDVEDKLNYAYVHKAKKDSQIADLMISGCTMQTSLLRSAFWYNGEVLECGIPRNDIFFQAERKAEFRRHVIDHFGIDDKSSIVLYAPTFRINRNIEPYRINWDRIIQGLRKMMKNEKITVIVRLHPNLIDSVDTSSLIAFNNVVDGTRYHDMQELLCAADMLITDYSSSMFDFAMQRRPCVLYATDVNDYDRGFYLDIKTLPFPLAQNEDELMRQILNFDSQTYYSQLDNFFTTVVGLSENGHASEAIAQWMTNHRIENIN